MSTSATVRRPAVAGRFYPGTRDDLLRDIRKYTSIKAERVRAIGCVSPHAGYVYSGHVAGAVFAHLDLPARFIVLCPNHTGMGEPLSIMSEGSWLTPLGEVAIDSRLARAMKSRFPLLHEDSAAHHAEHAIEVQLPFLQSMIRDFTFVPVAVGTGHFEALSALGATIATVIKDLHENVLIIASSDMNHYEQDATTRVKDSLAIERMLALDSQGLHRVVQEEDISMCGYGPAVAMLTAANRLGAEKAELVKYATSGDISGDFDQVVGYAGIVVS
jgi:hypothetical protein